MGALLREVRPEHRWEGVGVWVLWDATTGPHSGRRVPRGRPSSASYQRPLPWVRLLRH